MFRAVENCKYVPIYKLLPGYQVKGSSIGLENGKMVLNESSQTRKLDRQTLSVNQLNFGLMKYKSVVASAYPEMAADLDRHMSNILNISILYSGNA